MANATNSGLVHPAIAAAARAALDRLGEPQGEEAGPVTVEAQRRTLQRILVDGGPSAVLLAGRRFAGFDDQPLVLVLLNTDSVDLLLEKVARLNRYFHSHHRHALVERGDLHVVLDHISVRGPQPHPVESLFVAGLYVALLEEIGCEGLRCAFPGSGEDGWAYASGRTHEVPETGTARWQFEWDRFVARKTLPGLDDLILADPGQDLESASVATQVAHLVRQDLARRWTVRAVADGLVMSPRTLQRRLHEEGTSLTSVLADCRIARARKLLAESTNSVTDIGYMLGFADTPHFTRSFTAAVGTSPSRWRIAEPTTR